ncbi:sugar phosphate isomerase/epimerase family protein [Pseudomonas sp. SP16.1]|uniref:sugar phosphate isomerase/epimerase family protein n=1 Tax=Pseudomonas sp. SP16.1 TaxID=3458854 RepID=UPI00404650AA
MRLAISNIAWEPGQDELIAGVLKRYGLDAIDVAPGKYFPDPANASSADIARVRQCWADLGIEITGMQALLFGTNGLNLFGSPSVQRAMLEHLAAVCRIGAGLGATRLVFGSPRNRDRGELNEEQALQEAVPFFLKLGDIAQSHGVIVCLEPNPPCYGANFMTTSLATATVVEAVAHPSIKMQLDTGALTINGEDPVDVLHRAAGLIGHVHASEPDLVTLGDGGTDHQRVADALRVSLPGQVVSIEMLASKQEAHEVAIERALQLAIRHYRPAIHASACEDSL